MAIKKHHTDKAIRRATRGTRKRNAARLVVLDGPGRGRKFKISAEATIGRSVVADVIIDDSEVSRRHAFISRGEDGGFMIEDLGSSNGTTVNGVPVTDKTPLNIGDKVQLSERVVLVLASYDPTEQEILQRQRLETLGRLAAGLAHDFNNMQAVITAGLDYLRGLDVTLELGSKKVADTLGDIVKASDRASELAKSLMAYARSDVDGYISVDVSHVCQEVLKFAERTFEKTITIDTAISGGLYVIGNSAELHQMLMNLCVNARDAISTNGTLLVRAEELHRDHIDGMDMPPGERHVLITVTDDGVGIDNETRERIFEPFFTTKTARAGFGLGLATVKEIVSAHGGTMDVHSIVGEGTTFRICLPAAASAKKRRAPSLPALPNDVPSVRPGTRVLIADDQEMVRRTFERILDAAGCDVITAKDGLEVIARYAEQRNRPDLVVLDLDMPAITGEEVITTLRDLDPQVRILVVSGHHEDNRERSARALGAVGFLRKPFSARVLITAVRGSLQTDDYEVEEERTTQRTRESDPGSLPDSHMPPSLSSDPGQGGGTDT